MLTPYIFSTQNNVNMFVIFMCFARVVEISVCHLNFFLFLHVKYVNINFYKQTSRLKFTIRHFTLFSSYREIWKMSDKLCILFKDEWNKYLYNTLCLRFLQALTKLNTDIGQLLFFLSFVLCWHKIIIHTILK